MIRPSASQTKLGHSDRDTVGLCPLEAWTTGKSNAERSASQLKSGGSDRDTAGFHSQDLYSKRTSIVESSLWLQLAACAMSSVMQLAWARGLELDDGVWKAMHHSAHVLHACCSVPSTQIAQQCICTGLTELQEHVEHGDKEGATANACGSCQGPSLQSRTFMSATCCQAG